MNYYLDSKGVSLINCSPYELFLSLCNSNFIDYYKASYAFSDIQRLFVTIINSPRVLFLSPSLTNNQLFKTGLVDEDDSYILSELLQKLEEEDLYAVVTSLFRLGGSDVLEVFAIHPEGQGVIDGMIRKLIIDRFLLDNEETI